VIALGSPHNNDGRQLSPVQQALEAKYLYPQIQPVPQINDKSRRLALQKRPQTSQQPVHLRLYQQELQKTKIALAK